MQETGNHVSDQMACDGMYLERLFREEEAREQSRQAWLQAAAERALAPLSTGEFAP